MAVVKNAAITDHVQLGRWALAARDGHQQAMGQLYAWLHPRLYAVALSVLGNTEDARDAAQDAFLIGITRLKDLRDPATVSAWFRRIVQHLCYRRSSRPHPVRLLDAHEAIAGHAFDELASDDTALFRSMELLPEKLRLALLLRYFTVDNDYDTLADRMGVPIGTVRSRLNDGKSRLREAMRKEAGPNMEDATDEWTGFYREHFSAMHFDAAMRGRLFEHLATDLVLILTSGREVQGRGYVEASIADDLVHGSWFKPLRVLTSGNLSVVDGENVNSAEHPVHCPPRSTMVLMRDGSHVTRLHLYDSPLPKGAMGHGDEIEYAR